MSSNNSNKQSTSATIFTHNSKYDTLNKKSHTPYQTQEEKTVEEYISLWSSDGYEFLVPLEWLCISQMIVNMVKGTGEFQEVKSVIQIPTKKDTSENNGKDDNKSDSSTRL